MPNKRKKTPSNQSLNTTGKKPKTAESPDSYFSKNPVWSFTRCDFDHEKWGLCSRGVDTEKVLKRLRDLERQTWSEIAQTSSGRNGGTQHHSIPINEIISDAQKRIEELSIFEEELFSISVTGRSRLWGIPRGGIYYLLWYDPEHEICPSKKHGT